MDTTDQPAQEGMDTAVAATVDAPEETSIGTSLIGVVNSEAGATLHQSGVIALRTQGTIEASQSGAAAMIAKRFEGTSVGSGVILAGDVSVSRGWIGLVASPKVEISEDSRVLVGPIAALIIAAAILGVFGIALFIGAELVRRAAHWRPRIPVPSVSWRRAGE